MKQLLQTKEDIRSIMLEAFSSTIPELKNLGSSYPIIAVTENKNSVLGELFTLFWIWLLPNNQAITYGENHENQLIFYPTYNTPVKSANLGIESSFKSSNTNTENIDDYTCLCVKKISRTHEGVQFIDKVIEVNRTSNAIKDIHNLYAKQYEYFECK